MACPVYIVDDNATLREFIRIVCEERGFSCRDFGSGEDFLEALPGLEPGCILLDVRMPKIDGPQVQATLIARKISMPLIFMTAHPDINTAVRSMRLGAMDFLEKPFKADVLLEALLAACLRLKGNGDGIAAQS